MTVTLEQVRAAAKEIVEEAGPEKFANCFYSYEGRDLSIELQAMQQPSSRPAPNAESPLCIGGTIVHKLCGVEALRTMVEGVSFADKPEMLSNIAFTPDAVRYMTILQTEQDADKSWADALDTAEYAADAGKLIVESGI